MSAVARKRPGDSQTDVNDPKRNSLAPLEPTRKHTGRELRRPLRGLFRRRGERNHFASNTLKRSPVQQGEELFDPSQRMLAAAVRPWP